MKILTVLLSALAFSFGYADVKIDQPAPAFSETDHLGKVQSLESNKGKWVVLEWYNEDCPYVKKHYGTKNMQNLQAAETAKGVVWLTVAGSAVDKQGYVAPKDAAAHYKKAGMKSTALLLDSDGSMGRAYGAKTTPHMFVINPKGMVVYAGAIDNNPSSDPSTVKGAENHVSAALTDGLAGKAVAKASTKPYGCSVKYN